MKVLGSDNLASSPEDISQANPQAARELSIHRSIGALAHACQCKEENCQEVSCQKMKRVVLHTRLCSQKGTGNCPICKQLMAMCCFHAHNCQVENCPVPFCSTIKQKLNPVIPE